MKKTIFSLLVAAIAISVLPSCIEETVPLEGAATSEQMAESSAAMKGSIDGMVAQTYQPYSTNGLPPYPAQARPPPSERL